MSVACFIEADERRLGRRPRYVFEVCPRAGDLVALPSRIDGRTAQYRVMSVLHVPGAEEGGQPASTVLQVDAASG